MERREIPNISNIPNSPEKIDLLLNIFGYNFLNLYEIYILNDNYQFGYTNESMRKMINHSFKIGILEKAQKKYGLSEISLNYFEGKNDIRDLNLQIIKENKGIFDICEIISIILAVFNGHIKKKTLYYIFSIYAKKRTDKSSISSVGRNLRSIFSLMEMADLIIVQKEKIKISDTNFYDKLNINMPSSLESKYNSDVYKISIIREYLNDFFDEELIEVILKCVTTFEYEDIYWNKGSLYKNQGEVLNLNSEYIMTFTIK